MSRRVDKEEQAHLQYETEHTEPPKSRSVLVYMVILIAAAFLLLLLAYFMQQRTSSSLEGLHQSVNSLQSFDQLVEDNRVLHEEVGRLKEEQSALKEERSELQDQLEELQEQFNEVAGFSVAQDKALNAWGTFWSLEEEFRAHDYKACAATLQSLADSASPLLPEPEGAQQRMEDIYKFLVTWGYLPKDDPVGLLFGERPEQ